MHALVLSLQKGTSTFIYSTFQICCSQCQYLTRSFFIPLLLPRRIKFTAPLHKQAGIRIKFFDRATAQRIVTDHKSVLRDPLSIFIILVCSSESFVSSSWPFVESFDTDYKGPQSEGRQNRSQVEPLTRISTRWNNISIVVVKVNVVRCMIRDTVRRSSNKRDDYLDLATSFKK